jgi:hypothetical protein
MDPIQPTLIFDSSAAASSRSDSLDVSRGHVGFVAGDRPHFADETAALLRNRLTAAALVIVVVLASAFAGNLPDLAALLAADKKKEASPPSHLNPAIPVDVEQIVLKCLAKKPSDRYLDAASLMQALGCCSVASGWGPEQAADWWRSVKPIPQPEPTLAPKPALDATLDSLADP